MPTIPIIALIVLISSTNADPIVIRAGLNKDHSQKQDTNVYDTASIKGIANFEGETGFNLNNENAYVKAQDAGKYGQEDGRKSLQTNEQNFAGGKFQQQNNDELSNYDRKGSHKKGHHKSGYKKSYHKDESEDNSSYFDDANDEGDEFVQTNRKNSYGDNAQENRRGQDYNNQHYLQDQAKNGYYDKAGSYRKDLGNRRDYNAKNYHDDHQNIGRRNNANQYGENDRYEQEKYIKRPHYYEAYDYEDPYYYRPRQPITVYEDPRYVGYERYPRYDNDYAQLDIRRPPYDDYYY